MPFSIPVSLQTVGLSSVSDRASLMGTTHGRLGDSELRELPTATLSFSSATGCWTKLWFLWVGLTEGLRVSKVHLFTPVEFKERNTQPYHLPTWKGDDAGFFSYLSAKGLKLLKERMLYDILEKCHSWWVHYQWTFKMFPAGSRKRDLCDRKPSPSGSVEMDVLWAFSL